MQNSKWAPKRPHSMRCALGLHFWRWVQAFHTNIVEDTMADEGKEKVLYHQMDFKGFECLRCGQKKLEKENTRPAKGIVTEALAWLNDAH